MTMNEFFLNVFVCFLIYIVINRIHVYFKKRIEKLERMKYEYDINNAHEVLCTKAIIDDNLFNYFKAEELRFGIRRMLVLLDKHRKDYKPLFTNESYSDKTIYNIEILLENIKDYHDLLRDELKKDFGPNITYIDIPDIYSYLDNYSKIAAICIDKIIFFQTIANKLTNNKGDVYDEYKK